VSEIFSSCVAAASRLAAMVLRLDSLRFYQWLGKFFLRRREFFPWLEKLWQQRRKFLSGCQNSGNDC